MVDSNDRSESDPADREAILEILTTGLRELRADIEATEPSNADEQQLQLRRYHELGYLANQYRKLKRDTDLDQMDERLEFLEDGDDNADET